MTAEKRYFATESPFGATAPVPVTTARRSASFGSLSTDQSAILSRLRIRLNSIMDSMQQSDSQFALDSDEVLRGDEFLHGLENVKHLSNDQQVVFDSFMEDCYENRVKHQEFMQDLETHPATVKRNKLLKFLKAEKDDDENRTK